MGTQRELLLEIVERTLTQLGARPPYPPAEDRGGCSCCLVVPERPAARQA